MELVSDGHKVFDTTLFHGTSNMLLWNSILRANVSNGCYEKAFKLLDKVSARSYVSWNIMVSSYSLSHEIWWFKV